MKKYIQKSLMLSAIILLIVTLVSFLCFEYKDEMKFNFLLVCRKESSFLYYQNLPRERRITSCPKEARKDYFHRCFSFRRMGWKWPLFTFCIFSALTALSLFIGVVFLGYEMPAMDFLHAILKNPLMLFPVLLISLISGPLNEEFGWRGFALDKLLVRFGFFGASLILGFIWGIWHLAWYFTPGQAQYQLLQKSIFYAFLFIPSSILLNFFVTFVYIKTRRSVLAGAIVHMFSNLLGSQLLAPYSTEVSTLIRAMNMLFFTCILIYTCVSRKFKNETAKQIAAIQKGEQNE